MITNKTSYVYIWNNSHTGEYYIGKHTGHNDDGYIGSGKLFNFKYTLNPQNWVRSIEREFYDEEYAYEFEQSAIENLWQTDPLCLNLIPGGVLPTNFFKRNRPYYKMYPDLINSKIWVEEATFHQWLESQLRPVTKYIGYIFNGRQMVYDRTPHEWSKLLNTCSKFTETYPAKLLYTCFRRTHRSIELDPRYPRFVKTEEERAQLKKIINNINEINAQYT